MEGVLEDNELKDFIDSDIPRPTTTNSQNMEAWNKNVEKERRILLG